ncbi:UNVERIFIED_ORG: hypothetical protein ABIC43_005010 [Variovorax guangxiensis]
MSLQHAPSDGSPVYIGYGGATVVSPDGAHITVWTYEDERPHSHSINRVTLDGIEVFGQYWGRGHAWSPDSAYFTLEHFSGADSVLCVVRVADMSWLKIAKSASATSFCYPELRLNGYRLGGGAPVTRFTFSENEDWMPLTERAVWARNSGFSPSP